LFHRLVVARVELPPLRERAGDVEVLAHYFCREMGGAERDLPDEVIKKWEDYAWPGNVRELRNAVARLLALGSPHVNTAAAPPMPESAPRGPSQEDFLDGLVGLGLPYPLARDRVVEEFERRFVERLLSVHGDVVKAAAASGVGKRYFQRIRARTKKTLP
jgi:DNA-binding NtrC family response regulator